MPDGEGGYVFTREVRGVDETRELTRDVLLSADARRVEAAIEDLIPVFEQPATWTRKDQSGHALRAGGTARCCARGR